MRKKLRTIAKLILALALTLALLAAASPVLANKGVENENYSAIGTYRGFYREPENSLDVLFLGTSHAYCAFSPKELEKQTGLKSWNLASSQQSLLTSYYWLKEALLYQHPKIVVLDCFYCFYKVGNEGSVHKAFDWMNLSPVKVEAVNAVCREFHSGELAGSGNGTDVTNGSAGGNGGHSLHPYQFLLPALRYHDRWSQLSARDLAWWKLAGEDNEKGYCPRDEVHGKSFTAIPGSSGDSTVPLNREAHFAESAPQEIQEFQKYYLDQIVDLCRDNGIRLILVKTPTIEWTPAQHEAVAGYADSVHVEFCDFNLEDMIQKCGYDFASDSADTMHANSRGAVKLTDAVARLLR